MTTPSADRSQASRLLSWVDSSYWAMYPPAFETVRSVIASWAMSPGSPPALSRAEKDAAIEAAQAARSPQPSYQAPTTIVVLSMFGVISPRSNLICDMSQEGCSLDMWSAKYKQAMLDPNVAGVIVNCDSPGGNVYQVPETANLIYALRDLKPNVGVVTGMSASACYFLVRQFKELVCSESAEVGSIGVLMRHMDYSKAMEEAGVKGTHITSPRDGNKAEGNPFTPLSADTIEYYNSRTDEYYDMFLTALVRGGGITGKAAKTQVDQEWGRGRMIGAARAVELGMVDRINTLQAEIDAMAQSATKSGAKGGSRGMQAEETSATDHDRARARLRLA